MDSRSISNKRYEKTQPQMKIILLDTSFLIECVKNKIDIKRELTRILDENFEVAILNKIHDELANISSRGGKIAQAAKLAGTILLAQKFIVYPSGSGHMDKQLLRKASDDIIVATMDKELKRKLKSKGHSVIIVRGRKTLVHMYR